MTALKETTISRYIGLESDTKPTSVPVGSTFLEYDTDTMFITYDGTNWEPRGGAVGAPIPFIFKPGQTNTMVASGTAQYGVIITTVTVNTLYYIDAVTFNAKRDGKFDQDVLSMQITIGVLSNANGNAQLVIQAKNNSQTNANGYVNILPLTSAFAVTATEIEKTYECAAYIPVANFNEVPFDLRIGVQCTTANVVANARLKTSSYIMGEYEPGS